MQHPWLCHGYTGLFRSRHTLDVSPQPTFLVYSHACPSRDKRRHLLHRSTLHNPGPSTSMVSAATTAAVRRWAVVLAPPCACRVSRQATNQGDVSLTQAAIARTSRCSPGRGREATSSVILTLRVYSARLDSWLPCCYLSRGSAPPFPAVQTGDPALPSPAQAFLGGKSRNGGGEKVSAWAGLGRCRGDGASSEQRDANGVLKHP